MKLTLKKSGWIVPMIIGLLLPLVNKASANDTTFFRTVFSTDVAVAGVGGMRNVGSGVITVAEVSGSVRRAYLYWHGPTNSPRPDANASVFVNDHPVLGVNIGTSSDNCWQFENSQAYRADVTSLVTGNGTYALTGFGSGEVNTNGASLIVFFDDGNPGNDRDIVLFHGNDSNKTNPFDKDGWDLTLSRIKYREGSAWVQLHVADGQFGESFREAAVIVNSRTLVSAGSIFEGTSVPSANKGPTGNGSLWDIKSFDITPFLSPGPNTLSLTMGYREDCLSLIVGLVNLPAGGAPGPRGWMEELMDTTTLLAIYALLAFLVERLTNGISILLSYWNWWRVRFDVVTAIDLARRNAVDRNRRVVLFCLGAIVAVVGTVTVKLSLLAQIGIQGMPAIADQILTGLLIASGGDPIREIIQKRERRREEPPPTTPLQVTGTLVLQQQAPIASEKVESDKEESS